MMSKEITAFTIEEIFKSGKYVIPIYQRNYAWKEGQIVQLLHDIYDFSINAYTQKYYIGTLVVYERKSEKEIYYETIDGQQRLTTINILYAVLKNEYGLEEQLHHFQSIILDFENRILSSNALNFAFKGSFDTTIKYNTTVEDAYKIIKKELKSLFGNNQKTKFNSFIDYINKNVVLLRVKVPEETDLNHYFEVMNNRGEQLEKHEILKSLLLSYLDKIRDPVDRDESKLLFNTIWEGCAQMERYIQYSFEKDQRANIFGDKWDKLNVLSFEDLRSKIQFGKEIPDFNENIMESELDGISIDDIISDNKYRTTVSEGSVETPERFNTIINFQNFLLHCLLILTKHRDATLDDKKLITNFEFLKKCSEAERISFVKDYAFNILKTKFLLDQYVIKREYINNREGWSLKRLYRYSEKSQSYIYTFGKDDGDGTESRDIILLLTMFHTVAPNMMYKHWLNASLKYLNQKYTVTDGIDLDDYKCFLELFAKELVFRRFLVDEQIDYYDLIYSEKKGDIHLDNINWEKLCYKNIENNLVFNYIDYLLIKKYLNDKDEVIGIRSFLRNFEFTFRSSVEHYYPQNPKEGFDKLDEKYLHSIGNLTLISHSKNSAMNNYMPKAKREHYKDGTVADSVKQYLMFNKYADRSWGIDEIKDHRKKIIELLKDQIN